LAASRTVTACSAVDAVLGGIEYVHGAFAGNATGPRAAGVACGPPLPLLVLPAPPSPPVPPTGLLPYWMTRSSQCHRTARDSMARSTPPASADGLARLSRLAGGSAGCAAGATLAALAGLTAGTGCPTVAAGPAMAPDAARAAFAPGTAVATSTAFAARAAAATITAGVVGRNAGTAGMHDGYTADGVGARRRRGAQCGQRRSQNYAGAGTQSRDINNLAWSAIPCAEATTSHRSTSPASSVFCPLPPT